MLKKISAILLVATLLFSTVVLAFAVNMPTISVSSATAAPGETVTLNVSLSDNPGINTFSFGFDYDTTRLSLTNAELAADLPGQFAYTKKAVWFNEADITTNGNYLKLTFKVLDNAAAGDAQVTVTYADGDISNYDEEDVEFEITAGKITVPATVAEDAPKIVVESTKTMAGKEIEIDLSLLNNPGIAGLAVTVVYDTNIFTLKTAKGSGMFSGFTSGKNLAFDESENVTDDGVIATLTFTVNEAAALGDYEIKVIPRSCTNIDIEDVEIAAVNGTISIIDFKYGDANADEEIDMKDVVILRKYIVNYDYDTESSDVEVSAGADANGDGTIDMKDVVLLRKYIVNYDYDTGSSSVVLGPQ